MSGSGSNKCKLEFLCRDYFSLLSESLSRGPESELHVLIRENSSSDALLLQKKQDKAFIVELKNGKVVFKQKPISFEKQSDTLQGISLLRYDYKSPFIVFFRNRRISRDARGPY